MPVFAWCVHDGWLFCCAVSSQDAGLAGVFSSVGVCMVLPIVLLAASASMSRAISSMVFPVRRVCFFRCFSTAVVILIFSWCCGLGVLFELLLMFSFVIYIQQFTTMSHFIN